MRSTGPGSSAKTTVALRVANAQAAGGIVAFIDAEHALDPEYAKALGVDTDALLVVPADSGEQALEIADMLVRSGALIIVIDSVAAPRPAPRSRARWATATSASGPPDEPGAAEDDRCPQPLGTTAIFINQLREKIGVMFGSPETTTAAGR